MKKLALALAFLGILGMVGHAYAEMDKCPKKGYHVDKDGKCVKKEAKKVTTATS